ncbi:hypothetical protein [Hymenobacter koreensis]|uniref:Uncharacterized protein n=1 Tax=Hymenobacter koreensis TaxID=1084523 RepID=A0ABP8IZF7_9BACT
MLYPDHFPRLLIEQPAHDEAEAAQLTELAQLLDATDAPTDVRDLAPTVRGLFPEPVYLVGCGSSHVWLHRATDPHRLAIIR